MVNLISTATFTLRIRKINLPGTACQGKCAVLGGNSYFNSMMTCVSLPASTVTMRS